MANDSYNFEPESPVVMVAMPTIGTIITLMNGGVLAILLTDRELRRHMFSAILLSLSACDLLVGLSLLLYSLVSQVGMLRNLISCVSSLFFMMSTMCLSNAQILYICVVRVIAVKHPHSFRSIFSLKRHCIYTAVLSLTIFVIFGMPAALWDRNPEEIEVKCATYTAFKPADGWLMLTAIVMISPYIATIVCYVHLIIILRGRISSQSAPSNGNDLAIVSTGNQGVRVITNSLLITSQSAEQSRTESTTADHPSGQGDRDRADHVRTESRRDRFGETVKTLGVIIGVMSILVVPTSLTLLVEGMVASVSLSLSFRATMGAVTSLNSLLNPLVYPLTMKKFQAALRRRFKCGTRN